MSSKPISLSVPKLIRVTTIPLALHALLRGQMRFMHENGFDVIMVSADGKERNDVMLNEGVPHHIIPMTRKITPVADLISLWRLYFFFRKEKPAIIHSHTPKAGLLAMIAGKLAGVKLRIHTVAGLRFMTATGTTRRILIQMEKLTAAMATHVWPNSNSLLQYILSHKISKPSKTTIIGAGSSNGINLDRYDVNKLIPEKIEEVKQQLKFDSSLIYLLSVGRIVKDKGIDELLKAFAIIHESRSNTRLVLLGEFENDLDPISDEAKKVLREHPAIIHINWSDSVEYFMHLSAVLIHPSYREGFPNVLLQAGAMNCPVLCSRIEGNIDIVEHAITGLIFEVQNVQSLEETLRWALANPASMKEYATGLRKKIEQQFDQRFVHESLKNKYLELLSAIN